MAAPRFAIPVPRHGENAYMRAKPDPFSFPFAGDLMPYTILTQLKAVRGMVKESFLEDHHLCRHGAISWDKYSLRLPFSLGVEVEFTQPAHAVRSTSDKARLHSLKIFDTQTEAEFFLDVITSLFPASGMGDWKKRIIFFSCVLNLRRSPTRHGCQAIHAKQVLKL